MIGRSNTYDPYQRAQSQANTGQPFRDQPDGGAGVSAPLAQNSAAMASLSPS